MNVSKKKVVKVGAAIAVGVVIVYEGIVGAPRLVEKIAENIENERSGYTKQIRAEEANQIMRNLNSENAPALALGPKEDKYIYEILGEANWAALQLKIPRSFIVAQWLMESGNLNEHHRQCNNPGSVMEKNGNLKTFGTLHDFTEQYVKILRRDGVTNSTDFNVLLDHLHTGRYFGSESEESYANKVTGYLRLIRNAGSEYDQLASVAQHRFDSITEKRFVPQARNLNTHFKPFSNFSLPYQQPQYNAVELHWVSTAIPKPPIGKLYQQSAKAAPAPQSNFNHNWHQTYPYYQFPNRPTIMVVPVPQCLCMPPPPPIFFMQRRVRRLPY